jgi:hypothetical protein
MSIRGAAMRIAAILASIALLFAACGGDEGSAGDGVTTGRDQLERREDDLRETVAESIEAFLGGDADAFYAHFSASFQARCEIKDFRAILALAAVFIGDLSEREVDVEIAGVRFEDDRAFVTARVDVEGVDFDDGEDEGSFSDFWVLEDGEWKADTEDEHPCDLGDGLFGGEPTVTGDDDDSGDIPAGPGASRSGAVAPGESVTSGDLRVTLLDVNFDAADAIIAADDFVDPPAAGNRYVLITVRVEHVGEDDESISVSSGDFELTGSRNVVYDTFSEESRCGFFSDEISGEMFPGGSLEGDVCFQVPEVETDLILIASPFFSFDDTDRRFLRLD